MKPYKIPNALPPLTSFFLFIFFTNSSPIYFPKSTTLKKKKV